ncbi:GNAT family N-acetyltransferase [Anditalea andensis]|uniref:GCN5 family acetyltransferase n=1 Tax=Anditalea andensis TaxID=1048983 RepID=A0A074KZN6_9BACT|nr:GNAT family N-acetyltransferase [Anditalea andensis]KEO73073.1 GCN5 family acetyltransferase [Anditalea andensis]
MEIRKGKLEESTFIATLIFLAMEDILYHFIGENDSEKGMDLLTRLVSDTGNQYSYENSWVVEANGHIGGAAIVYDGGQLNKLRRPVEKKIKAMFNRPFDPEDETKVGEYYIDSIGVDPMLQGKGIGSRLIQFLIGEYVYIKNVNLGLLVDKDNQIAKNLYVTLGFEPVGEKTLANKNMEHLQFKKKA